MRQIFRHSLALGLLAGSACWTASAVAKDPVPVEERVDRIEKELRAVQRKVFPGGAPVQPDITAAAPSVAPLPTSTPVTDLIARVTALETQLATLTGQVEQNSYRLRQIEDKLTKLQTEATPPQPSSTAGPVGVATTTPPKAAPTGASEARKAAVAAIERPDTGDAANDAYVYGFRLWDAKFYPEAQVQLKAAVEKYGDTAVGSRTQNLLGRAYLDDGKPALASVAFYENYQKRPNGDRAAQSLAYLGEALIQLKKPADACKVYKELEANYSLTDDLKTMAEKGRVRARCGA
ncbi:MAG: hypothetical protein AB7U35_00620 [Sphingobium sp.]